MADSSTQPSHPRRSEPISKPAGLHLKKRFRLSHVWGPAHLALLGPAPALRDYRLPNMTKRAILLRITGGIRGLGYVHPLRSRKTSVSFRLTAKFSEGRG